MLHATILVLDRILEQLDVHLVPIVDEDICHGADGDSVPLDLDLHIEHELEESLGLRQHLDAHELPLVVIEKCFHDLHRLGVSGVMLLFTTSESCGTK